MNEDYGSYCKSFSFIDGFFISSGSIGFKLIVKNIGSNSIQFDKIQFNWIG